MTLVALFVGLVLGFSLAVFTLLDRAVRLGQKQALEASQANLAAFLAAIDAADRDRFNDLAIQYQLQVLTQKLGKE